MILIVDLFCKWCFVKNYIFFKASFLLCNFGQYIFVYTHCKYVQYIPKNNVYRVYQNHVSVSSLFSVLSTHFVFKRFIFYMSLLRLCSDKGHSCGTTQQEVESNLASYWFTKFLSSFTIVNYNLHTLVSVQCNFGIFP